MKNTFKYLLLCLLTVFSCIRQEEMAGDMDTQPIYSDDPVEISAEVSLAATKVYMGEKDGVSYPFYWQSAGESLALVERASLIGREDYSAIQNVVSLEEYHVSDDCASADFTFYVKTLTNGDAFEYSFISPASSFVDAREEGVVLEVPVSQTPAESGPDPAAMILWTKMSGKYTSQPSSVSCTKSFSHPLAYVRTTVKNLPLKSGEKVVSTTLTFEGKAVTGLMYMDWKGGCEPAGETKSFVNLIADTAEKTFTAYFTAIPFDLAQGDKIMVKVATEESVLTREITVAEAMSFPSSEMTSFGIDMSSAKRNTQVIARLGAGQEYSLDEVSEGIFEAEIPYKESTGLTFIYKGAEYGVMAASGSGMVGTHSNGKHLSRTTGRLAVGGDAVRLAESPAETVIVRLDASYGDNIPRYYLELPETGENVVFHEDFSLMVWGGDYYTWAHGVTPAGTPDAVDGTETATSKADYTQAPFGNKPFDETNQVYVRNRGLEDWTLAYCCERPYAMQVGHSNGTGSVTFPAWSSLTKATDVNLYLDMARFGSNSSGIKVTVEITGSGTFEKESCTGSRDAYTCSLNGSTSYNAMLDVLLSEKEINFSSDLKRLSTTSNGQGKIFPRAYSNSETFKPHTKWNLRILGADATTRIKMYGEGTNARFVLFDIKVVKDEEHLLNGTVINENSTLYGIVRDNTTGRPIAGVPMTDGFTYVTTDANGVYQMVAHEQARCIYPSVPAEYEIPMDEDNQPLIHKYITDNSSRYDFYLEQRETSWDDFTIMAITDVHFYSKGDDQTDEEDKFKKYHVPDITNYLSSASVSGEISKNVIAVSLGDNTSNYTEKLSHIRQNLYSLITMNGKVLPMFHAIGNHDHRGDALTDYEASADFVNVFGPTDFSINIGRAHIVFMDNTMCEEAEQPHKYGQGMSFIRGITDEQWAWLQADLANVKNKESKLLIMCMHAPIFGSTYSHFGDIRNQMKIFGESHIMTGHLHKEITRDFTDVWNGKTGRLSQEHNLLALGANWTNGWSDRISVDGTPMGYNVFNISGNMIKESIYNPVGQEDSYQFRIYNGGDKYENDKTITREDETVTYKFDWTSLFRNKYADETMDMNGKFVVKVFAAGTRQKYWDVYLVDAGGKKTRMKWHEKEIYDVCTLAYFYVHEKRTSADYAGTQAKNVWTIDIPEAYKSDPAKAFSEGGYKVVAEYTSPGGKVFTYENNHLQSTKTNLVGGFLPIPYEYYYKGFGY